MLKKDPKVNQAGVASKVAQGIAPLVEAIGLELVDVEIVKEGPRWYLRVYIDRPQGIDLEVCQQVSHLVGEWLDIHDPIKQPYTLEVSSPGLERPLKKVADFERFKGRKVNVTTFAPIDGAKEFSGELVGIEDSAVVLKLKDGERRIPYNMVASSRLAFDLKTE